MRWFTPLVVAVIVFGCSASDEDAFSLDEVELRLLEPPVVPDPVDGSRWWYTPSRTAHIYRHKYPKPTGNELRQGEDLRLPGDILPRSYYIRLLPFIEVGNWTTNGYVEITIEPVASTINITMNALDLTIDPSSITVLDTTTGNSIPIDALLDEQETREIITIQVSRPLTVGRQYVVSMSFISILNNLLAGFYRSSYVENGVTK